MILMIAFSILFLFLIFLIVTAPAGYEDEDGSLWKERIGRWMNE